MLHRRTTNNTQHRPLGRSKSTNSTSRASFYALHSDPIVAEREAHIAARLSYQRAHGRKSEGMADLGRDASSPSLDPAERSVSRRYVARSDSTTSQLGATHNTSGLAQQSIRFTGPNARLRRPLGPRASENRTTTASADDGINASLGGPSRRARRTLPSQDDGPFSTPNPYYLAQTPEDHYAIEENLASIPSSYRRIRKSRSMFAATDHPQGGYSFTNSPAHEKPHLRSSHFALLNEESIPTEWSNQRTLRAPKSMTSLPHRRDHTSSHTRSSAHHDLAVQLAREKFREQAEGQMRLKSYPSLFFRSKARRTEGSVGMRKSLRNSSSNSAALSSAFSGESLSVPKQGRLRGKARKVSKSIKTKLKGIFSRQRSSEGSAGCAYGDIESNDFAIGSYLHLEPRTPAEETAVSSGPSRIASLHTAPSCRQMQPQQGSLDSYDAKDAALLDEKSRVTSWTDSVTDTAISQRTAGDWERQHLEVIRENGAHVSSPTPPRQAESEDFTVDKAVTVDSQRIYSALMKRANEAKQKEVDRRQSIDDIKAHGIAPNRRSSVAQAGSWSPPTIRCVQPDDDVFQDGENDVPPKRSTSPETIMVSRPIGSGRPDSHNGSPNPWLRKDVDRTPSPERASLVSRTNSERTKTLTQRSSAFFASPSNHLFRAASPFRRLLHENMRASEETEKCNTTAGLDTKYLGSLSAVSLPTRCSSATGLRDEPPGIYAESVYSNTEENVRPEPSQVEKLSEPPSLPGHGGATIFVESPGGPCRPLARDVSEASSFEWKTWLSAHVSKLEDFGPGANKRLASASSQPRPRLGHVREKAEIESSPEVVHISPKTTQRLNESTPLKPLVLKTSLKFSPKQTRRVTPGVENEVPWDDRPHVNQMPLATPQKSSFRTVPSCTILNTQCSGSPLKQGSDKLHQSASFSTASNLSSTRTEEPPFQRPAHARVTGATGSPNKSSPGLTAAVERQFGQTFAGSPFRKPRRGSTSTLGPTGSTGRLTLGTNTNEESGTDMPDQSDTKYQTMTSKQMVEMFLNDRRSKAGGSVTSSSDGSSLAFL